jgi:hypothetical protein
VLRGRQKPSSCSCSSGSPCSSRWHADSVGSPAADTKLAPHTLPTAAPSIRQQAESEQLELVQAMVGHPAVSDVLLHQLLTATKAHEHRCVMGLAPSRSRVSLAGMLLCQAALRLVDTQSCPLGQGASRRVCPAGGPAVQADGRQQWEQQP